MHLEGFDWCLRCLFIFILCIYFFNAPIWGDIANDAGVTLNSDKVHLQIKNGA